MFERGDPATIRDRATFMLMKVPKCLVAGPDPVLLAYVKTIIRNDTRQEFYDRIRTAWPCAVRALQHDDFCVVYEDPHLAIYFDGKGVWGSDALVGYEIRLPKDLASMEPGDARAVWERVREYVLQQNPLHWRHQNVSMRPFAEESAGR